MALSLQARFWRMFFRKTFKEKRLTIAENRAWSAKNAQLTNRIPKDATVEKFEINGVPAAWIRPSTAAGEKIILHFHGGGYVTGSIDSHLMMCIPMAQTLKMNLLLPEYRLAPENPFPAALDDALKSYRWLLTQGYKSSDIIVSGDSAGGEPLPAVVVVMSPWADLTHKGQSHVTKADSETVLKTEVLKEWALCYADEANLSNPLVSPVYADFHGFPPLLIQVGSEEILLDDSLLLTEKAKADGVAVTLKVWDGIWHVWQALGDFLPESRKAFEELGQFVQEHVG
jgi:monoterpene epsilon-lactone hydrolase